MWAIIWTQGTSKGGCLAVDLSDFIFLFSFAGRRISTRRQSERRRYADLTVKLLPAIPPPTVVSTVCTQFSHLSRPKATTHMQSFSFGIISKDRFVTPPAYCEQMQTPFSIYRCGYSRRDPQKPTHPWPLREHRTQSHASTLRFQNDGRRHYFSSSMRLIAPCTPHG
jgi:hypothetical protein